MTSQPGTYFMRSTKLSLLTNRCAHAVTQYEKGNQWDRAVFGTGVAAHDINHALGRFPHEDRTKVANHVCEQLIRKGRIGYDSEGPLSPDAVFAGRKLVMEWLNWGGNPQPHQDAKYEVGIGVDENWNYVPYEVGRFSIRLDVLYPVQSDDAGWTATGICVRDYKTSWAHTRNSLESIQLRAQAVAAWRTSEHLFPGLNPSFIRREITNLRTRESYYEDTWLTAEGIADLELWQSDVDMLVQSLEETAGTEREATVSKKCLTCPFQQTCRAWLQIDPTGLAGTKNAQEGLVDDYIMARSNMKRLEGLVRELTKEGPLRFKDKVVGTLGNVGQVLSEEGPAVIAQAWLGPDADAGVVSSVTGLLASLKPGVTSIKALARKLHKGDRASQAAFVSSCTKKKMKPKFDVYEPETE
jgi:hypothetical protein